MLSYTVFLQDQVDEKPAKQGQQHNRQQQPAMSTT
jgi:hypothetical protein